MLNTSDTRRRFRRLACLAALAAAALAGTAQPASAAIGWHFGPLVETTINDCYTSDVVNGVGAYAGAHYDASAPPKTGEVFYVNVVVNGIDASCAEITMSDIKLPAGVSPAISAQNPIKCFKVDNSAQTETPDTADCPSSLGAPLFGGTGSIRNPNGPAPGTWDTRAPNAWEFQIPLTAKTAGSKAISFPTQVISGSPNSLPPTLEPSVSLPVDAGSSPHKTFAIVSKTSSAQLTSKGVLSFSVVPQERCTGSATGTIKVPKTGKVVRFSKRRLALAAHKRTKVTLKLSRKNASLVRKALRQRRKVVAKIALSATALSGDTSRKTMSIRLKP